jgi:RNA polymerase sigma-70 factor (ECF subfamily)
MATRPSKNKGKPYMPEERTFHELLQRVRSGDESAAEQLVQQYEPMVRFEARLRLTDPRLRRQYDSLDICQSVLASFFVRAAAGQHDLERPEQLIGLLATMVRNKVASKVRRQQRRADDHQRDKTANVETLGASFDPSRRLEGNELLQEVQQLLTAEERRLVALRGQGQTWMEVAATMGGTAEGRRKQLARALDLVAQRLGIDEGVHA